MATEQHLYDEFKQWCRSNRLPHESADELLARNDLNFRQRTYLEQFIDRWNAVVNPWHAK